MDSRSRAFAENQYRGNDIQPEVYYKSSQPVFEFRFSNFGNHLDARIIT